MRNHTAATYITLRARKERHPRSRIQAELDRSCYARQENSRDRYMSSRSTAPRLPPSGWGTGRKLEYEAEQPYRIHSGHSKWFTAGHLHDAARWDRRAATDESRSEQHRFLGELVGGWQADCLLRVSELRRRRALADECRW